MENIGTLPLHALKVNEKVFGGCGCGLPMKSQNVTMQGGECGCGKKIPLVRMTAGNKNDKNDLPLEAGLTNYLDLNGLSPLQKKKFKKAADILKIKNNLNYSLSNSAVEKSGRLHKNKYILSENLKDDMLDDIRVKEKKVSLSPRLSPVTRSMARKASKLAEQMEMGELSTNKNSGLLLQKTRNVLRNIVNDSKEFKTLSPYPSYPPYPMSCNDLTETQKMYALNANNGVKGQYRLFQMSILPSQKRKLNRSPTNPGKNKYVKDVAALWKKAKQCV